MRSKWSVLLSVAMGGALAATGSAQEKVIKVGTLFPLTGPVALAGERCKAAVETMAEVIINLPLPKQPGILDGYKIVLVNADTQGKPDVAKSEAERLFNQEGCYAIIGCYNSSCTKPASAVAERENKIFLAGCASSSALTERGLKNFFRFCPTDRTESQQYAEYFKALNQDFPGAIKTVGVIYENSEFGVHAANEASQACKAAGMTVVADVPFNSGATNLNSEVQTIKAKNPDAVIAACLGGDYTLWVRTMKMMGLAPKAVMNFCSGYQDPIIAKQLAADGNFFLGSSGYSPEIAAKYMKDVAPVEALYRKKTGVEFDSDSIQEAVALYVLAMAIDKSKTLDVNKVVTTIRNTVWDSPLSLGGKIAFDANGQNTRATEIITQLKNLNYVSLYPKSYAEAKVTFPFPGWDKR